MPNAYLTGTSDLGVVVNSPTDALTQIANFATSNNWVVQSGSASSPPLVLRNEVAVGGIKPFYRFSVSGTSIVVQMDLDGTGTSLSPSGTNTFTDISVGTKLWIASYEGQFLVIYLKPASGDGKAMGLGWPRDRFDPNYAYSWILWNLDTVATTNTSTANKRVARRYNTTTSFDICNATTNSLSTFITQNLFTGNASAFNVASSGGKPVLVPVPVADGGNLPHGFVPLMVNGLCGAPAGAISVDPATGIKYLCTGAGNHAFQISDPTV